MGELENFINDRMRLLVFLQSKSDQFGCAHITQPEMAEYLGVTRKTIYNIIRFLSSEGYVNADARHPGRYWITEKAQEVLHTVNNHAR